MYTCNGGEEVLIPKESKQPPKKKTKPTPIDGSAQSDATVEDLTVALWASIAFRTFGKTYDDIAKRILGGVRFNVVSLLSEGSQ